MNDCITPPVTHAIWNELNQLYPGRRTTSDGSCPGGAHHQANPSSDHEPDPRLSNYSCAADISNDPAHGVNSRVLGERIKNDPRVKYVIAFDPALHYDVIWNNERGDHQWRDANQRPRDKHNQGGGHLHVSWWHNFAVLRSTAPFLHGVPPVQPQPPEDEIMAEVIYVPDGPIPAGPWKGMKPSCSVYETASGDPLMAFQLSGPELTTARKRKFPMKKKPAVFFVNLAIRPFEGPPKSSK